MGARDGGSSTMRFKRSGTLSLATFLDSKGLNGNALHENARKGYLISPGCGATFGLAGADIEAGPLKG